MRRTCLSGLVIVRVERELGVIKSVKHYGNFLDLESIFLLLSIRLTMRIRV